MIAVNQASQLIQGYCKNWGLETIPIQASIGRVLAESLYADRDFPPFTRVSMDGIAIKFETFEKGQRNFQISGIQAAGSPPLQLEDPNCCLEVMTGAVIPVGADTVIRYEDLEIENGQAKILIEDIRESQNAHQQGSDRTKGDLLLSPGRKLGAPEIGVAATLGYSEIQVYKNPRIKIISTGDELVPVDQTPLPYQIRQSNGYTIEALLKNWGYHSSRHHLLDDKASIKSSLQEMLENTDVFILTGGVSKGKYDYLPEIFEDLNIDKVFHRVEQRPGKPFWFGIGPSGQLIFALPGNPVSSFMCSRRYVIPFLDKSLLQKERKPVYAQLSADISFRPNLTYFAQVTLHSDDSGKLIATPIQGRGSGDLANLVETNAFIELPIGKDIYKSGEVFEVLTFNQ